MRDGVSKIAVRRDENGKYTNSQPSARTSDVLSRGTRPSNVGLPVSWFTVQCERTSLSGTSE
jgi:hypothetical protein